MPNPAGFFAVARVHGGVLQYLIDDDGDGRGRWSTAECRAIKYISRANAQLSANDYYSQGAGVVVRTFQAVAGAASGIPAQAERAGRPRAALPPSTNRGGKSKGQGAGA